LDGQLARQGSELAPLLDKFVCVRIVQAYGLDMSLFQFDGDLTFAVFFLNPDRTIYGRYGTRVSHEGDDTVSLSGLKAAMESALQLHSGYPGNKSLLTGKQGGIPKWRTPEAIPKLPGPKAPADGSRGKCIHCHQIGMGFLLTMRDASQPVPVSMLWSFPNPTVLGLDFDPAFRTRLRSVPEGSPAFKAGLRAGDDIETADGETMISIADVQWVLQQRIAPGRVVFEVLRNGKKETATLELESDWRKKDDFTWRTMVWPLRLQLLGFRVGPLSDAERRKLALHKDQSAFKVAELPPTWLKEANRAAEKAGLKKGDVIVGFEGRTKFEEKDLLAFLVLERKPGEMMTVTVRRGDKTFDVRFAVK
jgi:serine protease Do